MFKIVDFMETTYHYVYQITEINSGKKYIGLRSCSDYPENDIGIKYFSSSKNKEFIESQKTNSSNYIYSILSVFDCREDAINEEIRLHELFDVGRNVEYINKAKQTYLSFDVSGTVVVKDDDGNVFSVSVDDPNYLNGSYKFILCGTARVKDSNGYILVVSVDDEKYISGEYVGVNKGKIFINDGHNNRMVSDKDSIPDGWTKGKLRRSVKKERQ